MRYGALIVLLLALLGMSPALAEEMAFGGSQEDRLDDVIALRDGLFAVGTTASSDGDLSDRTRSGETGWALRIDAQGKKMWNFCSAKSGMMRMSEPYAFADGTFSLVLTDDTFQRGEWIHLSERGIQISRVAIPEVETLCPNGLRGQIVGLANCSGENGPYLGIVMTHADNGSLCCVALFEDGMTRSCGEFYGDNQGVLLGNEAEGTLWHIGVDLGALALTRLEPGTSPRTHTLFPLDEGMNSVSDALIGSDGSMTICGQTMTADQKTNGFLLRLSAEGEVLFAHTLTEFPVLDRLIETETGYAVYAFNDANGVLLYFDEDGGALGEVNLQEIPLDVVNFGGTTMLLTYEEQRGAPQAVFVPVSYLEMETVALAPVITPTPAPSASRIVLGNGYLLCSDSGASGVTVSMIDAQGRTRWKTRTPIHTAADRLVWESAEYTREGDIKLSGHYETNSDSGVVRENASALLSADGVLRGIHTEK